ncbi:hypothetical protein ACRALDRAFT_2038108 [Sodiomyces alcalophilus JCM 7366]|uniref:uncharacterized protein n=1 Tax=Sodiomyces alcalophilus JCM 7366 TaxID=591952 RepID=UPI0039B49081
MLPEPPRRLAACGLRFAACGLRCSRSYGVRCITACHFQPSEIEQQGTFHPQLATLPVLSPRGLLNPSTCLRLGRCGCGNGDPFLRAPLGCNDRKYGVEGKRGGGLFVDGDMEDRPSGSPLIPFCPYVLLRFACFYAGGWN